MNTLLFSLCLYVSYLNGAGWKVYTIFSLIYVFTKILSVIKDITTGVEMIKLQRKVNEYKEKEEKALTSVIKGNNLEQTVVGKNE